MSDSNASNPTRPHPRRLLKRAPKARPKPTPEEEREIERREETLKYIQERFGRPRPEQKRSKLEQPSERASQLNDARAAETSLSTPAEEKNSNGKRQLEDKSQ